MLPIVLIPGFMMDASLWDDLLPVLQTLGPITHGDIRKATTIAEMARHVLADAPERFALISFSMGGYVAREIARLAPNRVLALVLIATSARADTEEEARQKAKAAKLADLAHFKGLSRAAVIRSLHPDHAGNDAMIERVRRMSKRIGVEAYVRQASQARESDLDRLGVIKCPTLIVAADRDAMRSLDEAKELRDGIDRTTLTIIKGSGHAIPIEKPAELAAEIVSWLKAPSVLTVSALAR